MIFHEAPLEGVYVIDLERLQDDRGFFARSWCEREFEDHGLKARVSQCNISFNRKRGTWRGMHYQVQPHEEAKVVRCTRGAIYDVIADLRPGSRTYQQHLAIELSAESRRMLYVPEGFAHGFLTLEDDVEVSYLMSESYVPDSARGFRWDDPAFSIRLPIDVAVISDKDRCHPDFASG